MENKGILIIVFALALSACQEQSRLENDVNLLLASNERQRQAHMENNADLLVAEMANNVLTVQRGELKSYNQKELEARWRGYFARVKYEVWDDLEPPIINVSEDGSLASVAVRKMTVGSLDNQPIDTTYFAWVSNYRKIKGQWKIYQMASTRKLAD